MSKVTKEGGERSTRGSGRSRTRQATPAGSATRRRRPARQQGRDTRTRRTPARAPRTLAEQADRHACYEAAVQAPDVDARFIDHTFHRCRARRPRVLREDFCGTAALCAEWVKLRSGNRALGIDLHAPTLNWGITRHLLPLGERAAAVDLICQDVRDPAPIQVDAVAAFNFSYFTFKDRATLRDYFVRVHRGLRRDGIFYLDLFGGPESMDLREERTAYENFIYVWDQAAFNPLTHEITCHIHFEFRDRSTIRKAFTYHWRLWTIPELREIAKEAGFRDFIVYWEGTDHETEEGNGVFRPSVKGDNSPAYICYLLCLK